MLSESVRSLVNKEIFHSGLVRDESVSETGVADETKSRTRPIEWMQQRMAVKLRLRETRGSECTLILDWGNLLWRAPALVRWAQA